MGRETRREGVCGKERGEEMKSRRRELDRGGRAGGNTVFGGQRGGGTRLEEGNGCQVKIHTYVHVQ